eukprot:1151686-Pelagomonas_calceolata.AAC.16
MHLAIARDCDQLLAHKVGSLVTFSVAAESGWLGKQKSAEAFEARFEDCLAVAGAGKDFAAAAAAAAAVG